MLLGLDNVNWEMFGQIVLVVAMTTPLVAPHVLIVNLELVLELQLIVMVIDIVFCLSLAMCIFLKGHLSLLSFLFLPSYYMVKKAKIMLN